MEEINLMPLSNRNLHHQFEELRQRASLDALSGLLNRATLEQSIKRRLQEMAPGDACALFIVDLDDFKQVNDTLGHQAGDQAIRQSAQILSSLFRAGDIVGRLGGDEFAVFLCGRVTEAVARRKAARTLQLSIGDHSTVNLTASVGIYLSDGSQTFEGMYQSADLALYKAKKAGKHGFCLKSMENYQDELGGDFRPVSTIPISGLLEHLDSGVALLEMGAQPRVIYVSPSFCRIIGVSSDSYVLPKPLTELIHDDDRLDLEQILRSGLRENRPVEHIHRVSADGSRWAWWHIRAVQIHYENPNPVMLVTAMDITSFKEQEQLLRDECQRLQTAFSQTVQELWEVDVQNRTFSLFGRNGSSHALQYDRVPFPGYLIDGGWIHPSSVARFRSFALELLNGQSQGYGTFILRDRGGGPYGWAAISYRALYDDAGRAVRAVGIAADLPKSFSGQESQGAVRRPLPDGMISALMGQVRANLTQDSMEEFWSEGKDLSGQVCRTSFSQFLSLERSRIPLPDFLECFDRDRLLHLFREGRRWISAEYQRADQGGVIHWVHHDLNLSEDPVTRDIYLHGYLLQADLSRQWEQALGQDAGRDPASGLYTPDTVRQMAEALFPGQTPGERGVALVHMDGLLRQPEDGPPPENRLRDAAAALSAALGGGCILGLHSADQLVALFPSVPSQAELRRRLEESTAFVRQSLAGSPGLDSLRFVTGVAVRPARSADFSVMLDQAAHVCGQWWNAAADMVAFFHEEDDRSWTQLQSGGREDQISVHSAEMERPLSEEEKDVALQCVSAMLAADSLETSIRSVLKAVGAYYQADRVYILTLSENRRVVTMPYEWTGPGKRGIQHTVSGMRLERFPLLERCAAEMAPVFLTRTQPISSRTGAAPDDSPWHFTTFPLIRDNHLQGFFCIENSREHPADAALFSTLIPCMLRERERFHSVSPAAGVVEQLMELPDLRSYLETVYTLDSRQFSSLGAVCLDIPGMAAINGDFGFEYGSKLLWYVSKSLTDIFGPSLLFRTWEAEFVAFCPNTTGQVFLGRCSRLRSVLQRRYPKEIRMGRAWSEGAFTGKQLADEARRAMRAGQAGGSPAPRLSPPVQDNLPLWEGAGRFTVYFQPKIEMSSGALFGAEALVRGVGRDGAILLPSQFIPEMEADGTVRDLDLFVLNQALAQMEQWRSMGLGVVRISVNLSRVSLFHPNILASILAIQSRYPNLPPDTLEVEITESAGNIEAAELQSIVERFHGCGLRVSLDDFGSQYANLSLFTNVKFDAVKLDRSLVTQLARNPITRMLIQDIIQICGACGMTCVAEGVESQEQGAALQEAGCSYAQGYYYDRPLPPEQFEQKYLRRARPAESEV